MKNIKEIDQNTGTIVVELNNSIQVWDILNSSLLHQFPLNQKISYKITSGYFVIWEQEKSITEIGIISLTNRSLKQLKIGGNQKVFLCEIYNEKIIIGMHMCHLQIIDINTGKADIIEKGVPKSIFQLEDSQVFVAVFNDGMATIIDNEISEIFVGRNQLFCNHLDGATVFCDKTGKIILLEQGKSFETWSSVRNVQQVGTNPDSHQIFLANKGKIYIFE